MIYQTIDNASQFADAFRQAGRADQFSYDGLKALFEYFDESEIDLNLDVVAICCDFAEYDSALACIEECGYGDDDYEQEGGEEAARQYLSENTTLLVTPTSVVVGSF